jgi:hypothetical protein
MANVISGFFAVAGLAVVHYLVYAWFLTYRHSRLTAGVWLSLSLGTLNPFKYALAILCLIPVCYTYALVRIGVRSGGLLLACIGLIAALAILLPPTVLILGQSSEQTIELKDYITDHAFPLRTICLLSSDFDPLNNLRGARWIQRVTTAIRLCPVIVVNATYPPRFKSFANVATEWRMLRHLNASPKIIIFTNQGSQELARGIANQTGGCIVTEKQSLGSLIRLRLTCTTKFSSRLR